MEKKQILCIGHITHDRIITPATPEGIDCAGGTAYYVAWAMNHMPHDVSFGVITAVGDDLRHEIDRLRQAGVDIEDLGSPTSVYFENSYGRNMNNRRQRVMSKAAPFTADQLKDAEAEVFHLGTLLVDDFAPEVVEHLAEKGRVCVDVQGYLREVLVTLGSYGSLIYADDRFHEIPGYPPRQTVDATGCGDTYAAGYLYARARGASCEEAGRLAAAMCTLKLEHTGPFDRTIEDVRRVLAQ